MNIFKNVIILIILLSTDFSCRQTRDSMETIRDFKPDNEYFKAAMVSLHFITETSATTRVDSAFSQMIDRYGLPVDGSGCQDGEYVGESPYDAYDYKHRVRLEIRDEKIVSVDYDEIHRSGTRKEKDKKYNEEMSSTGTTPSIAYPYMEKLLLEAQNMMEVDAVSGATYSLYRFRYAVTVALMKAKIAKGGQR